MAGRRAVVLCGSALLFACGVAAGQKLTSMTLEPVPAPAIGIGRQIVFKATGNFTDGPRMLGGMGNPMLWHVLFQQPELRAVSCGSQTLCCQIVIPDAGGAFDAIWSENNNVRAVGSVSPATVHASLSCVSGPGGGSLSASWNGTFYSGSGVFDGSVPSAVAVKGLTWSSSNPAVASIDDRGIAVGNGAGTATIRATFGSTCWAGSPEEGDCSGSVLAETMLTVEAGSGPPPETALTSITSFTTAPSTAVAGAWDLSWSSTNAATNSIDNGVGIVPIAGSVTVTPKKSTVYTLTSTGVGGRAFAMATVTVSGPRRRAAGR